jgi:hypothetical protein
MKSRECSICGGITDGKTGDHYCHEIKKKILSVVNDHGFAQEFRKAECYIEASGEPSVLIFIRLTLGKNTKP